MEEIELEVEPGAAAMRILVNWIRYLQQVATKLIVYSFLAPASLICPVCPARLHPFPPTSHVSTKRKVLKRCIYADFKVSCFYCAN